MNVVVYLSNVGFDVESKVNGTRESGSSVFWPYELGVKLLVYPNSLG